MGDREGDKGGLRISVLIAQHDDDDDCSYQAIGLIH